MSVFFSCTFYLICKNRTTVVFAAVAPRDGPAARLTEPQTDDLTDFFFGNLESVEIITVTTVVAFTIEISYREVAKPKSGFVLNTNHLFSRFTVDPYCLAKCHSKLLGEIHRECPCIFLIYYRQCQMPFSSINNRTMDMDGGIFDLYSCSKEIVTI